MDVHAHPARGVDVVPTRGEDGEERLEAYIDPAAVTEATKGTFGKLGTAPQNARFKVDNGRVTIVPSKDGVGPDISALASDLTSALGRAERSAGRGAQDRSGGAEAHHR